MLLQSWFIGCNKSTFQVGDVDNEGGEEGQGVLGKSWYLLLKFVANLKLLPPPKKKQHLSLPRVCWIRSRKRHPQSPSVLKNIKVNIIIRGTRKSHEDKYRILVPSSLQIILVRNLPRPSLNWIFKSFHKLPGLLAANFTQLNLDTDYGSVAHRRNPYIHRLTSCSHTHFSSQITNPKG